MLVNGKWAADWQPVQGTDAKGGFVRQTSSFRHWVTPDGRPGPTGEGGFPAAAERYHLYVALICPWASRTLAARKLKRLEEVVTISVVEPTLTPEGWRFGDYPGADRDELLGATYIHEVYTRADAQFTGRATVPVLWDKQRATIVNNESSDIVRMFNSGFGDLASDEVDLYPAPLQTEIDALNARLYGSLNNGVYRAGFAVSQGAYEEAFEDVFGCRDELEARLEGRRYLVGETLTETEIRAFVTLVRFDIAYHGAFKCNRRRLIDYPHLQAYLMRLLAIPAIQTTVDVDHIKRGYYSVLTLNPNRIVPAGPEIPGLSDLPPARPK